jgi:predicted transcriptional regulator of viral defense system
MIIADLIRTKKTIFTIEDIAKIANIYNANYLRLLVVRMTKRKELIRIKRGIYAYTPEYDQLELANKLKKPSYISLERVLFDNGIIFQDYSQKITSVSNNTCSFVIGKTSYSYNKIKDSILTNPLGIVNLNNTRIAQPERAICDMLYITKDYHFDNLRHVNKNKLLEIAMIYNKRVIHHVKKICST